MLYAVTYSQNSVYSGIIFDVKTEQKNGKDEESIKAWFAKNKPNAQFEGMREACRDDISQKPGIRIITLD